MPTPTSPPDLALTSLPDASSSISALFLRLNLLEDLLALPSGSQSHSRIPEGTNSTTDTHTITTTREGGQEGQDQGDERRGPRPGQDLTTRLETLERGLTDLVRGSGKESLRRFVDRFDSIQVLLRHVPDPRTTTSTSTSSSTTTANTDADTRLDKDFDHNTSSSTTTSPTPPTSILTETKLSLVLPSTQTLLAIPAQYTALRALLDRGVDGAGGLGRYFTCPRSTRSDGEGLGRKVEVGGGRAEGDGSTEGEKNEGKVKEENEEVDAGKRIRAIRRTLDARNFGHPPSLDTEEGEGESSASRQEAEERMGQGKELGGGARAENLRRVGEVLGRWDAFIKDSSQIFLNLHQTMTDLEWAVERAERTRGIRA